ncbi:TetR/AcrR family transcriptional regulator [Sphingomonas sp.]|uniref:TetR/AcrR family transcriptional regulator n=1 Tax=Sphingomonas sp. TaxID=28214 RepID=UPI0035C8379B
MEQDRDTQDVRARVLDAASRLIAEGGVAALTTRAVASAASVQAPTLYRLFGEKRGLLHAVAEHGLATFLAHKASAKLHPDPVQDLADAWDSYIGFGLANPAVFAIMNEIGSTEVASPAALAGLEMLRARVRRIAQAGRLGIPVERAVGLIHAAGVGTVATLLVTPEEQRDPQLADVARGAVLSAILADAPGERDGDGIAPLAIALGARLGEAKAITPGERLLLTELLDRLSRE